MAVEFKDFSIKVKDAIEDKAIAYLHEAAGEVEAQTKRNTRVGNTGQTKASWSYVVDESALEAQVGNPLENAIWEEFGTGEYALHGDGRKGGWTYRDEDTGEWHHTYGKTPNRALHSAFTSLKAALKRRAQEVMGELNK